jgi:hypothetical protein
MELIMRLAGVTVTTKRLPDDYYKPVRQAFAEVLVPGGKFNPEDGKRVIGKSLPGGWGYTEADARLRLLGVVVEKKLHNHPKYGADFQRVHSDETMADIIALLTVADASQHIAWETYKAGTRNEKKENDAAAGV